MRYRVYRRFFKCFPDEVIARGLTLEEARAYCTDPETSSRTATSDEALRLTDEKGPWFDGYEAE